MKNLRIWVCYEKVFWLPIGSVFSIYILPYLDMGLIKPLQFNRSKRPLYKNLVIFIL